MDKVRGPEGTSIGQGNGIAMPWTPLMRHMVLLKQHVKEDKIFTIGEGRFGTSRGTEVWWDPPIPLPPKETRHMCVVKSGPEITVNSEMMFAITIDGIPAIGLFDSGASHCYNLAKFTPNYTPLQHVSAQCAGENRLQIKGKSKVTVRMGTYSDKVKSYAVEQLIDGVDMIFGQDWFMENMVIINYAKMTCTIRGFGNVKHTIYPLSRGPAKINSPAKALAYMKVQASEGSSNVSCDVVSAKRAVKSLVKGADT